TLRQALDRRPGAAGSRRAVHEDGAGAAAEEVRRSRRGGVPSILRPLPDERMKIRRYEKRDAKPLLTLVRALARYAQIPPISPAPARRITADAGRRIRVLMAEVDGRPVGYAIYFFTYSSFLARPTLFLEDLFVLPEQRREGIGARFFDALLGEARREGCGRME